jgi:hypothetical protein
MLWRNQRRRIAEHHSLKKNWQQWPIAWSNILETFRSRRQSPRILLSATA